MAPILIIPLLQDKGRHREECVEAAPPAPEWPPKTKGGVTIRAILFSTTEGRHSCVYIFGNGLILLLESPRHVKVSFNVLGGKWRPDGPSQGLELADKCTLFKDPKGRPLDKPLQIYYCKALRDKASPPNKAISGWIGNKHPHNVWGGPVLAFKCNADLQGYSQDDFDSADLAVLLDLIRTNKPSASAGVQPQPSPPFNLTVS